MSDNIGLQIDPPKGVKETITSLQELITSVEGFEKKLNARTFNSKTAIEEALGKMPGTFGGVATALKTAMESLTSILNKKGGESVDIVRSVNKAIQQAFEQRLASVGTMTDKEIASWRKYGVTINGLQKAQLADSKAVAAAIAAETALLASTLAAREKVLSKLGELAIPDTGLRLMAGRVSRDGAEVLAAMNAFYTKLEATEARKNAIRAKLSAFSAVPTESSASVLKRMRDYYSAQEEPKGTFYKSQLTPSTSKGTFGLPTGDMGGVDPIHPKAVGNTNGLTTALGHLGAQLTDVHSLARGLASGFNLLWLTWGSMTPILAGAAISMSFTNAIKQGRSVAENMADIQHLAGATSEDIATMTVAMRQFAEAGAYGPVETAKALQILSLAGLNTRDSLLALKPALDFAVTGGMDIEKSAESLIAISTAYGYSATGISTVADIVSKTAAMSMASVSGMTESFRVASAVAQQFGVTLEDSALNLAFLSQIGVKGTAAGTAMTNFYAQLLSGTGPAKKALKELGVEGMDAVTNSAKPMITIIGELDIALRKKTVSAQQDYIQAITSNRGSKDLGAALTAYRTKVEELDPAIQKSIATLRRQGNEQAAARLEMEQSITVFKKYQDSLKDAAGFSAIAAAGKSYTPDKLVAGMGASLSSALVDAFKGSEDALTTVAVAIKRAFNSGEFKSTIAAMVAGVTSFVEALEKGFEWLLKHKDAIGAVITEVAKLAVSIAAGVAAVAAWGAAVAVFEGVTTVVALMAGGFGFLEASILAANLAFIATPAGLVATGIALAAGAAAYLMMRDSSTEAEKAARKFSETEAASAKANAARSSMFMESLTKTIQNYRDMAEARQKNVTLQEVQAAKEAELVHLAIDREAEAARAVVNAEKIKTQARLTTLEGYGAADGIEGDNLRKAMSSYAQQEQDIMRVTASRHSATNQAIAEVKRLAAIEAEYEKQKAAKNRLGTGTEGRDAPAGRGAGKAKSELDSLIASIEKFNSVSDAMAESSKKATEAQTFEAGSMATLHKITNHYTGSKAKLIEVENSIAAAAERRKAIESTNAGAGYITALQNLNGELDKQVEAHSKLTAAEKLEESSKKGLQDGTIALTYWEKVYAEALMARAKALEKLRSLEAQAAKAAGELKTATGEAKVYMDTLKQQLKAETELEAARDAAMQRGPQFVARLEAETAARSKSAGSIVKLTEKIDALKAKEKELKANKGVLSPEELQILKEAEDELSLMVTDIEAIVKRAGNLAEQKWITIDRDRIAGDLAGAVMTGLTEGGQEGARSLRDVLVKEFITNPIQVWIKATISEIIGGTGAGNGLKNADGGSLTGVPAMDSILGAASKMANTYLGGTLGDMARSSAGTALGLNTVNPMRYSAAADGMVSK